MNNVEAMTPVQPGAYKAVYSNGKGEFRTEDVIAIVAYRAEGGWVEFEPVSLLGSYKLRTPPLTYETAEEYHGMFTPDEARAYIEAEQAKRANA
jgi:hypothetical protein